MTDSTLARTPARGAARRAGAAVLVVALVLGATAVEIARADPRQAAATVRATSDEVERTPVGEPVAGSSPPTAVVVERSVLPAGTSQVATVRPDLATVLVRSSPPPGWDRVLTPVVSSDEPQPPASGLDLERTALPSVEVPISGRHVEAAGWRFSNPGTYTPPQPLRFGVVQQQGPWLEVRIPVRPNGTTGYLRADQVELSTTTMSVQVSLGERRLRVIDSGFEIFTASVAVGRPTTPTPTGSFYVTDVVPSADPDGGYGPVALALNGYSEVMDSFAGENGEGSPDELAPVLAIHGTNRPDSIGRAASNGCPRLANGDMLRLAALVPAGTPVQIWP